MSGDKKISLDTNSLTRYQLNVRCRYGFDTINYLTIGIPNGVP